MAPENNLTTQNTAKKKVLVLTSTFPRWQGDVEPPFVFELCRRLNKTISVHVLAPHAHSAAVDEQMEGIRVTRYRYFFSRWQNLAYHGGILANLKQNPLRCALVPFFILAQLVVLIRLLNRYRFDCIHAHWLIPQGLVAITAGILIKSAPPVLVTSHGGDLFGLNGCVFNRLKRFVVRRSTAVTVASQAMKQTLHDTIPGEGCIRVVPMGVDLQHRFIPPAKRRSTGVVLFVGRLVEKKGLQYLIEAMPSVLSRHPQTRLRIVGAGQEKAHLKKRITELGIDDQVAFRGAVANAELPEIYQSADVVVFPSIVAGSGDREGFGLVLVEALGCECATIVTDLPAMRDVIQHEASALVVPQKDPGLLAEKINLLLDDFNLRQALGKEGRQYVLDRFDWQIVADRYQELINSVVN